MGIRPSPPPLTSGVPGYGWVYDCSARKAVTGCQRASMTVDLRGTGFVVSPQVRVILRTCTTLDLIPYIGNFSRRVILAKMTLGRCVKFSLSLIFAISRTLNENVQ